MATRMQQRRGTAEQWTLADPVLAAGEIGFETDTGNFKIGDGVNFWFDLPYFQNSEALAGSLDGYVLLTSVGASNGVASLDANGYIPTAQLGNLIDGAPGLLDTLNELAAALGDDPDFATNIASSLSTLQNDINTKKTEISQTVSSNITAVAGYRYFVDTTAARTITLPLSPSVGDEVQILDATNNALTHNVTIENNGEKIEGVAEGVLLDINSFVINFIYTGSTYGWRMV